MQQITEHRKLFLHELRDVLGAEQAIERILDGVQGELQDEPFRERVGRHVDETRQQIQNLEKAFERLGEQARPEQCPSVAGLQREHEETSALVGPGLKDVVAATSQAKLESYEIASYRALITAAQALGESEVAALLEENLQQEEGMLSDVELNAKRIAQGQKAGWTLAP